jgi:hypothetical protein
MPLNYEPQVSLNGGSTAKTKSGRNSKTKQNNLFINGLGDGETVTIGSGKPAYKDERNNSIEGAAGSIRKPVLALGNGVGRVADAIEPKLLGNGTTKLLGDSLPLPTASGNLARGTAGKAVGILGLGLAVNEAIDLNQAIGQGASKAQVGLKATSLAGNLLSAVGGRIAGPAATIAGIANIAQDVEKGATISQAFENPKNNALASGLIANIAAGAGMAIDAISGFFAGPAPIVEPKKPGPLSKTIVAFGKIGTDLANPNGFLTDSFLAVSKPAANDKNRISRENAGRKLDYQIKPKAQATANSASDAAAPPCGKPTKTTGASCKRRVAGGGACFQHD